MEFRCLSHLGILKILPLVYINTKLNIKDIEEPLEKLQLLKQVRHKLTVLHPSRQGSYLSFPHSLLTPSNWLRGSKRNSKAY